MSSSTQTTPNPVARASSQLAIRTRWNADPAVIDDCRRNLTAAKLERAIREAIAAAPPLTNAQRVELGHLLTSGGAR